MKIETTDRYKGFDYMVVALPIGHRCGYVRIPENHYLFNKDYSENLKAVNKDVLENQPVGKRGAISLFCWDGENVSMEMLFNVHGGITFAGDFKHRNIDGYWIGFDCAHCDDGKDFEIMDDEHKELERKFGYSHGVARSRIYVEKECKSLIDQIIEHFG